MFLLGLQPLAPPTSYWVDEINRLVSEVRKRTKGRVKFIVFAGGVAGDEGVMLRKMRLGTIEAAILSFVGMGGFEELFKGFGFHYFISPLMRPHGSMINLEVSLTRSFPKKA